MVQQQVRDEKETSTLIKARNESTTSGCRIGLQCTRITGEVHTIAVMFEALIQTVEQTGQPSIADTATLTTKTTTTDLLDMANRTDSEESHWIQLALPRRVST
jgi:hypothetical protein